MPRRNNRDKALDFVLEDVTPVSPIPARELRRPGDPIGFPPSKSPEQKFRESQERAKRQRDAGVNGGVDWSICLVPGCGEQLRLWGDRLMHRTPEWRDHTVRLPLCLEHLSVAYHQAHLSANEPLMVEAVTATVERKRAKEAAIHEDRKVARKAMIDGDIYYLRLNGLIKVGWSRNLYGRLKDYGPDVEVLCHHPGTRHDETDLHRTFRPYLARGREWYEDCELIQQHILRANTEHGEPTVKAFWTQPKRVVAGKRHGRTA